MLNKLGLRDRTQAVVTAYEPRLVTLGRSRSFPDRRPARKRFGDQPQLRFSRPP
jgi:hypothetical protein